MSIALPNPVAAYFAAEERGDLEALARCFVEDGGVRDEGGTFNGIAAIKQWNAAAREKYHHSVEPISAIVPGGQLRFARADTAQAPTKGRVLDHIGFDVKDLQAFIKKIEAEGIHPRARLESRHLVMTYLSWYDLIVVVTLLIASPSSPM